MTTVTSASSSPASAGRSGSMLLVKRTPSDSRWGRVAARAA